MKIQYDKEADAKYITLSTDKKVVRTTPKEDWLLIDYDKDNKVIGIEILDSSRHQVGFSIADGLFGYSTFTSSILVPKKNNRILSEESHQQIGELNFLAKKELNLVS